MDKKQSNLLNKIFTVPYFDKIINGNDRTSINQYIEKYLEQIDNTRITYGEAIEIMYRQMEEAYRNEYYFKNELLNQLLLNGGNEKDTTAITELPIEKSKADMIFAGENGVVYEIKTDLDDFARLNTQLHDYYMAFPYIYLVVGPKHYKGAKEICQDTTIGIYLLDEAGNLIQKKKAEYNKDEICFDTIFRILRKKEYENIILKNNKTLPDTTDFKYYRVCKEVLRRIDIMEVQKEMVECLGNRRGKMSIEDIKRLPYALKFYGYFTKSVDYERMKRFLETIVL